MVLLSDNFTFSLPSSFNLITNEVKWVVLCTRYQTINLAFLPFFCTSLIWLRKTLTSMTMCQTPDRDWYDVSKNWTQIGITCFRHQTRGYHVSDIKHQLVPHVRHQTHIGYPMCQDIRCRLVSGVRHQTCIGTICAIHQTHIGTMSQTPDTHWYHESDTRHTLVPYVSDTRHRLISCYILMRNTRQKLELTIANCLSNN